MSANGRGCLTCAEAKGRDGTGLGTCEEVFLPSVVVWSILKPRNADTSQCSVGSGQTHKPTPTNTAASFRHKSKAFKIQKHVTRPLFQRPVKVCAFMKRLYREPRTSAWERGLHDGETTLLPDTKPTSKLSWGIEIEKLHTRKSPAKYVLPNMSTRS